VISCRVLGPVQVSVDGGAPPPELLWRKNIALLIYLARSPGRRRTREHLVGVLWGDKSESSARHSLREAIRVIRRSIGEDAVGTEGDQVRLEKGAVELDVEQLEAQAAAGSWAAAARLVAGEFLEGFSVPDASPFEDWLLAERVQWRRRSVEALTRHAEMRLAAGATREAVADARRASALDPASERALRVAMQGIALDGDRADALQLYTEARAATGTRDAETDALAERLRRSREWHLSPGVRVASERGAESRRAPLEGREQEMAALVGRWHAVRADRKLGLVMIEADSGFGKTRLAQELVARVELEGGVSAVVRAVPADVDQPMSGMLGVARGGLLAAPGVAGTQRAALATLAANATEWAERFPAAAKEPAVWSLGAAVADALRAASESQPVLLLIDDAQWLDEASGRTLEAIVRDLATAPVLVMLVVASQPPPVLQDLATRVGRDVPGAIVRLQPLPAAAIKALARWALPSYTDDETDRLARRVMVDSAGLPLLAIELLHAVALGLDLKSEAGAWPEPLKTLDQTLPGQLPDAITAAIRVGVRRLSAAAQQAMIAVAVLGERVGAASIGRAAGLEGDALHAALDELEWQRWLVSEPRGYAFLARVMGDVVRRDMVTPGQRQRMIDAAKTL
jgi:DNA-binding SARP family transcriptional activator